MGNSQELLDLVTEHFKKGLSQQESAKILGKSKNTIAGVRHRLGLIKPLKERKETQSQSAKAAVKPKEKLQPKFRLTEVVDIPAENTEGVSFLSLKGCNCRWPIFGESAETRFCGEGRDGVSPYCERHHEVAKGGKGSDSVSKERRAEAKRRAGFAFSRRAS